VEGFHRGGGAGQHDRIPAQIGEVRGRRLITLAEPVRFDADSASADATGAGATSARAAVPGAWEIPMRLVRAEWDQRALREVLATVNDGLGLPADCDLSVEPRSLIICEKGQFIPPIRESASSDDTIGGLTVTLPSTCCGGDLLVDGEMPAPAEVPAYGIEGGTRVTAYRGDCTREVMPVKSGYRIMLDFSLHVSGETARPAGDEGIIAETAVLLREHFASPPRLSRDDWEDSCWEPAEECPARLVYLLDDAYAAEGLDWRGLSDEDAHRVRLLHSAADRAGCELMLAIADVTVAHEVRDPSPWNDTGYRMVTCGDREYELDHRLNHRISLTRWTEQDGRLVRDSSLLAAIPETCASSPLRDREPDHWHLEPHGDGQALERRYHRAAVIVWPRERGFANRAAASPSWALEEILAMAGRGDVLGARALAVALTRSWGQAIGEDPEGQKAPGDLAWIHDQADRFHRLFGQTLRTAAAVADPDVARALLEPFRLEDLTNADVPALQALLDSYGAHWTADRVRDWYYGRRSIDYPGGRPRWIADQLRQTCARLHAADDRGSAIARLLLSLSRDSVLEESELGLAALWSPFRTDEDSAARLACLGEPFAVLLITAASIDAAEIHDQVCAYLLRQPPEIATALEMPILRALDGGGGNDHAGFGVLAADCATRLRGRLALTDHVPARQSPYEGGLTPRERRSRDRDTADLTWLTTGWRHAA
jgi:hypothetical protein